MGTLVQSALASALFGKVRWTLLGLFFSHPDQSFYLREIAGIACVGHGAIQRELANLVKGGILIQKRQGRQLFFQVNQRCPVYEELKSVMVKTAGIAEVLREGLAPLSAGIVEAFIYGSQADGTARSESDVDLLVVGDVDEMALHRAVTESERRILRPVNYTLLSGEEYQRRRGEKQGFLSRVLKGKRIRILGGDENV